LHHGIILDESNNKTKVTAAEKMDERDEKFNPSKFILSFTILKKIVI
jgi:hypothetical protein